METIKGHINSHLSGQLDGGIPDGEMDVTDAALRPQDELALNVLEYAVTDPTFAHLRPAAGQCRAWMKRASGKGY